MREYDRKRNFTITAEPQFTPSESAADRPLRFVIQRHDASRLHFDFRLECDGALKSWAVPKGPSLDPIVKRLAVMVEDHPLDYANFEGQIPAGQYGAGEVVIWDEGTYRPEDGTGERTHDEALVLRGLAEGKLSVVLDGLRLQGGFTLVRKGTTENWFLIKQRDATASSVDPTKETGSVRTGRTSENLKSATLDDALRGIPGVEPTEMPARMAVMSPVEIARPFTSGLWTFEAKLDGVRVLGYRQGNAVKLITRNGNDIANRFPSVVAALKGLPEENFIFDGELVLPDDEGRPSFQSLMEAYNGRRSDTSVVYWVFDLLYLRGHDLRAAILSDRRAILERVELGGPIRLLDTYGGDGETLYEHALEIGFEGVVGKRLASRYREGYQGDDWVKVKGYHTEEFLIGGYTGGFGAREHTFSALLLGRRDEKGELVFCGSVGGGFSESQLKELKQTLEKKRIKTSPFEGTITTRGEPVFVEPELVAEVRFMSWTKDRRLRFPIFKRLRPDVAAPTMLPVSPTGASEADAVLEALETKEDSLDLTIDGFPLKLTSLDRELWPGITKRDLIRYTVKISDTYLAHLRGRPLTFVRYPQGIAEEGFFQRHWDKALPEFVVTSEVWSDHNDKARTLLRCDNLATLVWLGQISALELHPWHSHVDPDGLTGVGTEFRTEKQLDASTLSRPDYLVCDLDPNIRSGKEKAGAEPELNDTGWRRTVEVAFAVRELFAQLGLRGYPKTSGKTGLHIYVPLTREYDSDQVREAARTLGQFLVKRHPKLVTTELRLNKRPDKVFFDANMNGASKTLAAAFSPRPVADARVSFPLTWDELETARPELYTIRTVPDLLASRGDAWANIDRDRQAIVAPT